MSPSKAPRRRARSGLRSTVPRYRVRLPKGTTPRSVPHTVFALHALEPGFPVDRRRLRQWAREGWILPVELVKKGGGRKAPRVSHYLVPVKNPTKTDNIRRSNRSVAWAQLATGPNAEGKISSRWQELEDTRALTLNLFGNRKGQPHKVLKGVGTTGRGARYVNTGQGARYVYEPGAFVQQPGENLEERQFWGGARRSTTATAVDNALLMHREWKRALKEGDPLIRLAARRGMKGPTLRPVAVLKPREYVINPQYITPDKEFPRRTQRAKALKVSPERLSRGITPPKPYAPDLHPSPRQLRQHVVFAYEVENNARVSEKTQFSLDNPNWRERVQQMGYSVGADNIVRWHGKRVPWSVVGRELLVDFAVQMAASLHLVRDRMGYTLTDKQTGSSFSALNVTLSGHPVDLDNEILSSRRRRPASRSARADMLSIAIDSLSTFWDRVKYALPDMGVHSTYIPYLHFFEALLRNPAAALRNPDYKTLLALKRGQDFDLYMG